MAAPVQMPMHTTFKEIKVHTAKCDECNKHNSLTIYRCVDCGQQCCTPCWNKKGGDGKHFIADGTMTVQKPVIVKAEDVEKKRPGRKKTAPEGSKKAGRKTVTAPKKAVAEETDDDEDAMEDVVPVVKKKKQAKRKPIKPSSKNAPVDQDETDDDLPPEALCQWKNTVNDGRSDDSYTDATSNETLSNDKHISKRKHAAISNDGTIDKLNGPYAWAYKHVAEEGRKRVRISPADRTTATIKPSSSAQNDSRKDQAETMEYANALLEFARGERASVLSSLASTKDSQDAAAPDKSSRSPAPMLRRPSAGYNKVNRPAQAYRESNLVNAGINTKDQSPDQPYTAAAVVDGTNRNKMEIDRATPMPDRILPTPKDLTNEFLESSESSGGESPHKPSQTQTTLSDRKNENASPTHKALQMSLISSIDGTAETGEIDLKVTNKFRLYKPAATGEGSSTINQTANTTNTTDNEMPTKQGVYPNSDLKASDRSHSATHTQEADTVNNTEAHSD